MFLIIILRYLVFIEKILEFGKFFFLEKGGGVKVIWVVVFMNINFNCENVIYFKNDKKNKIVIVYKYLLIIFLF